jgi:hypothetical protein
MTTAVTFQEVAQAMSLVAILLLMAALFGREIVQATPGQTARRFARAFDIAYVPLLVAFALMFVLNQTSLLG